jgi:hypothetical protein
MDTSIPPPELSITPPLELPSPTCLDAHRRSGADAPSRVGDVDATPEVSASMSPVTPWS